MAFSLFGKKPEKKPEKAPVKKVEARKPAAPPPQSPEPADDGVSLDFTNYAPPAASQPAPAPQATPPEPPPLARNATIAPAVGLDFSQLAAEVVSAPSKASDSVSAPPAAKSAPPPAPAQKKAKKPVDSILCIEVEEGAGPEMPAAIEEAAVLFANGQASEALARLTKSLGGEDLGAWQLQAWLMLFDVLQHLNRKQEFEELALQFVVKFERSPPVWTDAPTAQARGNAALRTGSQAHVGLSGVLSAASAAALEQLKKAADRQSRLRIDFAKLQGVEPEGAQLLLALLRSLRNAKKDVYFTGEQQALKLLRDKVKAGDASIDQSLWLLLLDLLQAFGMQQQFEEAAVDYAITYEVSPPSWDAPPPRPEASLPKQDAAPEAAPAADVPDDVFYVDGELAGSSDPVFAALGAYAAAANPVIIEMAGAKRVDFVNAGRLLNVLEKLKAEEKPVVIRGAREMIVALFAVMGITKIARIIPRK